MLEKRIVDIVNADLAYSLRNYSIEVVNLLHENCDSTLLFSAAEIGAHGADAEESEMRECVARGAKVAYAALNFMDACEVIIPISAKANFYMDSAAPRQRPRARMYHKDNGRKDVLYMHWRLPAWSL